MGKIEDAVRAAVARSVASELKRVLTPLAGDIKELKRTLSELQKAVPSAQEGSAPVAAQPKAEVAKAASGKKATKAPVSSPAQIRSLRTHLGLTQDQMAAALGVSTATVQKWQSGHRKPTDAGNAALEALSKKIPAEVEGLLAKAQAGATRQKKVGKPGRFAAQVKGLRTRLGLTMDQMAKVLGMSDSTIKKWEHGERKPTEGARAALEALGKREPEEVAVSQARKKAAPAKGKPAGKASRSGKRR